jgi:hypothetical protein
MTDKPQLYVVEDTGSAITNDELDAWVLDADAQADRMSFDTYKMTKDGLRFGFYKKTGGELLFEEVLIAGPFEILGRARDPNGDDWARWIRFKDADGRNHQVAIRDADLHGDPRTLAGNTGTARPLDLAEAPAAVSRILQQSGGRGARHLCPAYRLAQCRQPPRIRVAG